MREFVLLNQYLRAMALPDYGTNDWIDNSIGSNREIDVSVIITSFNYADHIKKCLESVIKAAELKPEIEIIVIDDASSDDSLSRLLEFRKTANIPISIIQTWWNVGVSRARNIAISRARGEYVFILDADNTISPSSLQNLYSLASKSNATAAFGPVKRVRLDNSVDGIISHMKFKPKYLLNNGNYIDAMALFRRQKILDIGGYNVSLLRFIGGWEDYALWLELAKHKCSVLFCPEIIGQYLVKPNSMVKKITEKEMIAFRQFAQKNYPDFKALSELK